MKFTFDDATGRYRAANGQFASRNTVRDALDKYLEVKTNEANQLAVGLRNREISLPEFQQKMRERIAELHLNGAMLAKGGKSRMTQSDYGRVGALVKFEYRQLEKLAVQIENGLPLDGRFMQRIGQYAQAGRRTHHVFDRREQESRGMSAERSILHARDSCVGCLGAAAKGWQPIGTLPLPGERTCRRNCKCSMEYRKGKPLPIEEKENSSDLNQNIPLPDYLASVPDGKTAPLKRRIKVNPPRFKKVKDAEKWIGEQGIEIGRFNQQETIARVTVDVVAEMKAAGFPLPEQIKVDSGMFTGIDTHETPAMMVGNRLFLNPNWPHWSNLNGLVERTKRNAKNGIWSSGNYRHILRHESGHHIWNSPQIRRPPMAEERIKQFEGIKRHFEGRISARALLNVDEFVSEVFAALMNAEKIDNRVLAYYREIGGPEPFIESS